MAETKSVAELKSLIGKLLHISCLKWGADEEFIDKLIGVTDTSLTFQQQGRVYFAGRTVQLKVISGEFEVCFPGKKRSTYWELKAERVRQLYNKEV